jgi:hypothetical protein
VETDEDIAEMIAAGGEFNITLTMNVVQMVKTAPQRERRVGQCSATFHVTPKSEVRRRRHRRRPADQRKGTANGNGRQR